MPLRVLPVTLKDAVPWVRSTHRRLPKVVGALWAVQVQRDGRRVGVALVGIPKARLAMGAPGSRAEHLEVSRVAVLAGDASASGQKGACSMLYAACSRAVRAMGGGSLRTYTHGDEHGRSLIAAGWVAVGETGGGEWDRDERQRSLAVDPTPKRLWMAPWCAPTSARSGPASGGGDHVKEGID